MMSRMTKRCGNLFMFVKKQLFRVQQSRCEDYEPIMVGNRPVIPLSVHRLDIAAISDNALKVLEQLNKNGYEAYLIGGCVRDLLLGNKPKDFDIATDAHPEQIRALFKSCRLIGRRFLLAQVRLRGEIIEVSTFRKHHHDDNQHALHHSDDGMILHDNVYGSLEEDVVRRDFTLNALYYTSKDHSIVDFTGGFKDLKQGIIRVIGDPQIRYREDPVRMLRAIRFMSKLNLKLSTQTAKPLAASASLLAMVSNARLLYEVLKLFHEGYALTNFKNLLKHELLPHLFPDVAACITDEYSPCYRLIALSLAMTDQRIAEGKPVSSVFLLAMLLWYPLLARYRQLLLQVSSQEALEQAMVEVIAQQNNRVSITKNSSQDMREIWRLQFLLESRPHRQIIRLPRHERFRAAYDLLVLRAQVETEIQEIVAWWTDFLALDQSGQDKMIARLPKHKKKK